MGEVKDQRTALRSTASAVSFVFIAVVAEPDRTFRNASSDLDLLDPDSVEERQAYDVQRMRGNQGLDHEARVESNRVGLQIKDFPWLTSRPISRFCRNLY